MKLISRALAIIYCSTIAVAGLVYLTSSHSLVLRSWQASLLFLAALPSLIAYAFASPNAVFPSKTLIELRAAHNHEQVYALFARLAAIYAWAPLFRLIAHALIVIPVGSRLAPLFSLEHVAAVGTASSIDEMIALMPSWQRQCGTALGLAMSALWVSILLYAWQRQERQWAAEDLEAMMRKEWRRREKYSYSTPPPAYRCSISSPPSYTRLYSIVEVEEIPEAVLEV